MFIALNGVAFSQQPSEFESLLASAQQAQARGDFEAAAESYRKAASVRPEIAELQANLGLMYYQTGKDQQAVTSFLRALHLKPSLFVPNLFLGLDYLKLKRFPAAIPYLKRAAVIKPTDLQTQLALGQAYAGMGKTRFAIDSYLGAVQADSKDASTWFHLGVAYLEQVEADARSLLARHKDSGYLHALVADTFAEQRALIQATAEYKTALARQTFPSGTHAVYGFVLLNQHDFQGADHELNAELALNPDSLMAKLGLARLQMEQGETRKSVKEVADLGKTEPSFLRTNASMFKRGLPASKISEFQRVLEEEGAAGEIPQEVVSLFEGNSQIENVADLERPSSTTSGSTQASSRKPAGSAARNQACASLLAARLEQVPAKDLRLLVSCAYLNGKFQTAFGAARGLLSNPATEAEGLYWETKSAQKLATEALAGASAIDSNSPTLHVLLGDVYRQRKFYPDAEQEYRKAMALKPDDTGALMGLSLTLLADSEIDQALQIAQTALAKSPEDPELNAVMGEILAAQHDFPGAEPYLKKALKTKPELIPHVHALLGKVYAEANHTEEAITELKLGLSDDKDGRLHYQIARLYLKVGDRDSAKQAFAVSERLRSEGLTRASVAMQQGENNNESQ